MTNKIDKPDYFMFFFTISCIIFVGLLGILACVYGNHVQSELGQAICEQEYNMDYKGYSGWSNELECKRIIEVEQYDGITIKITGD